MAARKVSLKKSAKSHSSARKKAKPKSLSAGHWFERLITLQKRLRAPDGCPWDRVQTHSTLRTYLIEESYEVLDALESGDDSKFAEEMGDLLLQIVFHSEIAAEQGRFTVADVIREVHEKMVRRHPHVFGEKRVKDATEVLKNWEHLKAQERESQRAKANNDAANPGAPPSLLDGVTLALPATLEGFQLTRKAARIGFDWNDVSGIFQKISEETAELQGALAAKDQTEIESELGDLLFAGVNLARFLAVDPEIALKKANAKFTRRFRKMEDLARGTGRKLADVPRPEMEALWDAAKRAEPHSASHFPAAKAKHAR
jgi:tetrapyrrole methylase family protein / MazG family protein